MSSRSNTARGKLTPGQKAQRREGRAQAQIAASDSPHGTCLHCKTLRYLTGAGGLRRHDAPDRHSGALRACPGSGEAPAEVQIGTRHYRWSSGVPLDWKLIGGQSGFSVARVYRSMQQPEKWAWYAEHVGAHAQSSGREDTPDAARRAAVQWLRAAQTTHGG